MTLDMAMGCYRLFFWSKIYTSECSMDLRKWSIAQFGIGTIAKAITFKTVYCLQR